jgi:Alginate lyase
LSPFFAGVAVCENLGTRNFALAGSYMSPFFAGVVVCENLGTRNFALAGSYMSPFFAGVADGRFAVFLELIVVGCLGLGAAQDAEVPRVFLLDDKALVETRERLRTGNENLQEAVEALRDDADESLEVGPFSVMDKPFMPPSGDKHDYMSVGPYWWPDPKKEDGLPYIRKDGEVNPERNKYDNVGMGQVTRHATTLAYAYWFTGDERYAAHAAKLVRTWYLDPATRMNPNLNFGQAIPGRTKGRGIGIIDTTHLPRLLDAVQLLKGSKPWTKADQQGLDAWFKDYTDWLTTHPQGLKEANEHNNHGTWYDVQVAAFALHTGDSALAKKVLAESMSRRIAKHIEPDGRQPHELKRTKSYGYSVMNLRGMFQLATLGEEVDIDLWHFKTEDGRSIPKALDWILEHAFGDGEWTYQNLHTTMKPEAILPLVWQAARVYPDGGYCEWLERLGTDWPKGRDRLFYSRGQ